MGCSSSGGPSSRSMSRATSATLRAAASFASSLPTDSRNGNKSDIRMSDTEARMLGRSSNGTFPAYSKSSRSSAALALIVELALRM